MSIILVVLNTVICGSSVVLLVPAKWIIPVSSWRWFWTVVMLRIGSEYIRGNDRIHKLFHRTKWDVTGLEDLSPDKSYLVLSNHLSTADIPVLQSIFLGRIPFPRFFIKQQLVWIPFLGQALWALDMPIMKRYSKSKLKQRPQLRGKDLETARKACEHLREHPVTLLNFAEGTRFTREKHYRMKPPYQNLLRPKSGGVHAVLEGLHEGLSAILNVTIVYPGHESPSFSDLAFGRIPCITVRVEKLEPGKNGVPSLEVIQSDKGQQATREWLKELWRRKDMLVNEIQQGRIHPQKELNELPAEVVPDPA